MFSTPLRPNQPIHLINLITSETIKLHTEKACRIGIDCSDDVAIVRGRFPHSTDDEIIIEGYQQLQLFVMHARQEWIGELVRVNDSKMTGIVRSILLSCDMQGISYKLLIEWPYPELVDLEVGTGNWAIQSPTVTLRENAISQDQRTTFQRFVQKLRMFSDLWRFSRSNAE